MRRFIPTLVLLALLGSMSGCFSRLVPMAKTRAAEHMSCDRGDLKTRSLKLERDVDEGWSHYRFEGCARWAEYRGSCEAQRNQCDVIDPHPECQGQCRVELWEEGAADSP